ncbi:MAG: hypothetical protein RTU63_07345 [Candidatus Thorarchaeota archaeon]
MHKKYSGTLLVLGLIGLLCIPTLILNSNSIIAPTSSLNDNNAIATDVWRNIRIAIYDEANSTVPSYGVGAGGALHNNATGMADILEIAGYSNIDLITAKNISEHCLVTAKYDVFIMVDNLPRENITHLVWEFWAGGGGILSLDGSATFLCYMGILPPEAEGTTGNGVYWINANDDLIINVRHPVTQSFTGLAAAPATILTGPNYLRWDWIGLEASSIGDNLVRIGYSSNHGNGIGVLAYEPDSGGNVVSISIDLVSEHNPDANPLIEDGVDWLCPRPKARIAFDFSHMPRLGVDDHDMYTEFPGRYSELRNSSVERGYTFDKLYPTPDGNITYDRLFNGGYAGYDLLILVLPDYPYSSQELVDIDRWVLEGRSLLVFAERGDYYLYSDAVTQLNNVLENMDCQVNMDLSTSNIGALPMTYELHLTNEYAYNLGMETFGYVNLTGPDSYELWSYNDDITMAASEYANGRVIVSADMNWATDNQITGYDNAQYLINAINWLTAAEINVLVYTDESFTSLNFYRTPVADALNDLGHQYYLVTDPYYLPIALDDQHWDLVVIDNVIHDLDEELDDLLNYVNLGGRLLMSSPECQHSPDHGLWNALGFEYAGDAASLDPVHMWNAYHNIFNIPHNYTLGYFLPGIGYGNPGGYLTVTTGTALGGWFVIPREGNASIVLGESGRTLYNSYVINEFTNDQDDSTYPDHFEFWENQIAFMIRPLLTHPEDVYMTEGDDEVINWLWDPPAQLFGAPLYGFEFRLNGIIEHSGFLGGGIVGGWVQRLSSLEPGLYIYDLSISGRFGFTVNDTVYVYIDEAPPVTTTPTTTTTDTSTTDTTATTTSDTPTTNSVGPPGEIPEIYVIGLVFGGLAAIGVLIAIFFKFKPVPANIGHALEKIRKV